MRPYLGELEQIVLLAVLRLSGAAYGVTIRQEIQRLTGRSISPGTIYPTIDRLERRGLVRSELSEPVAARGGRSRRICTIRPEGIEALRESHQMLQALKAGFEDTLAVRSEP